MKGNKYVVLHHHKLESILYKSGEAEKYVDIFSLIKNYFFGLVLDKLNVVITE